MPHLDRIRNINLAIVELIKAKSDVIAKAVQHGMTWQFLAPVDRIEAVKLCRNEVLGRTVVDAHKIVEEFLG